MSPAVARLILSTAFCARRTKSTASRSSPHSLSRPRGPLSSLLTTLVPRKSISSLLVYAISADTPAYNVRFAAVGSFAVMVKAIQHELQLARRMSRLGTETAFEVLNKARALERQGKDIIHLEIGEPDFDTPRNVVEAGVDALRKGWTHYGPSAGLPELRQTIAKYVSQTAGVKVTSEEGVVGPGGKPILF